MKIAIFKCSVPFSLYRIGQAPTAEALAPAGSSRSFLWATTSLSIANPNRRRLRNFSAPSIRLHSIHSQHSEGTQSRYQLNHAGASPSPPEVTARVVEHMQLEERIGGYAAAATVQEELQQVYKSVADLIHASSPNEIALTESATVSWTRAFYALAQKKLKENNDYNPNTKNKELFILTCDAEYAANLVAMSQWARDWGWRIVSIPSKQVNGKSTGIVDLEALDKILSGKFEVTVGDDGRTQRLDPERIAMACITHIPTNSGIVNPVEAIGEKISSFNQDRYEINNGDQNLSDLYYLVDACQSTGQRDVDVSKIHCHALVATGRKYLRGPRGTGFLYINASLLDAGLLPDHIDHYGVPVQKVPDEMSSAATIEDILEFKARTGAMRFEFWESNVANRLGLGKAVDFARRVGIKGIQDDCERLSKILRERLRTMDAVELYHDSVTTCAIVTFLVKGWDSLDVKGCLQKQGFELSVVPATSTPLDSSRTRTPDLLRASISYTTTVDEIELFCRELSKLILYSS